VRLHPSHSPQKREPLGSAPSFILTSLVSYLQHSHISQQTSERPSVHSSRPNKKDIASMANRYKPPQKRNASGQNYFGILTNESDEVSTSTTHLTHTDQRRLSVQTATRPVQSSNLRGDSVPYTPVQSRSTPNSTSNRRTDVLNQTSRPKTPATITTTSPKPHCRTQSPCPPQFVAQHSHGRTMSPKPSVKHLTCYFWNEFGQCQWSAEECLYAHWETGKVASAPVQVEVGSNIHLDLHEESGLDADIKA